MHGSLNTNLSNIREPVWSYLRDCCPSFRNRDCNAQFSEIFSSRIFNDLTPFEKSFFQASYFYRGVCQLCNSYLVVEEYVIVSVLSITEYPQLMINQDLWPFLIESQIRNSIKTIQCYSCLTNTTATFYSFTEPRFRFIEFSPELALRCKFKQEISIFNSVYILKGLVRHNNSHFTCAIANEANWVYFDDLIETVTSFSSLEMLYRHCSNTWFFSVYMKYSLETNFPILYSPASVFHRSLSGSNDMPFCSDQKINCKEGGGIETSKKIHPVALNFERTTQSTPRGK